MRVNEVYEGDCLEVMRQFPDNCIDAILTDPPYGLEFMGKGWDYGLPGAIYWREALRIAKPGASLMAFGGTRTYHRLVCAIEDAGWEIRDCIDYFNDGTQAEWAFMASLNEEQLAAYLELHYPGRQMAWIYGSGFPKSKDISKAIDDATIVDCQYCRGSGKGRPNYMIFCPEHGEIMGDNFLCPVCDGEAEEIELEREPCKYCGGSGKVKGAKREVVGETIYANGKTRPAKWSCENSHEGYKRPAHLKYEGNRTITAPVTPLAKQFDGWGTALKPSYEPIVVAQKPIDQNYAHNAEKWGVSGIWVDGGRIDGQKANGSGQPPLKFKGQNHRPFHDNAKSRKFDTTKGRWPANIIHDGSEEVEAEFAKAGMREQGVAVGRYASKGNIYGFGKGVKGNERLGYDDDNTSASRYFAQCPPDPTQHPDAARFHYCPKASTAERGSTNNHPTVKPLSLMRYLAKLTKTPTGGIVLDPFAGSGTTALACIPEGREYILIEKEPEYAEICRRRIAEYTGQEIAPKEIELTENEKVKQLALW